MLAISVGLPACDSSPDLELGRRDRSADVGQEPRLVEGVGVDATIYAAGCVQHEDCVAVASRVECYCGVGCRNAAVLVGRLAEFEAELERQKTLCSDLECNNAIIDCFDGAVVAACEDSICVAVNGSRAFPELSDFDTTCVSDDDCVSVANRMWSVDCDCTCHNGGVNAAAVADYRDAWPETKTLYGCEAETDCTCDPEPIVCAGGRCVPP